MDYRLGGVMTISTVATKIRIATAASAIAAAATLTPGIAQAEPAAPVPLASVGSVAGSGLAACDPATSPSCASTAASPGVSPRVSLNGGGNLFQNDLWWFGPANPNPPAGTTDFFTFNPLPLIPGFLRPLYGWFTQNLDFQACFAGFSVKVGPYGTVSGSVGRHC